jgi:hypothetical protein
MGWFVRAMGTSPTTDKFNPAFIAGWNPTSPMLSVQDLLPRHFAATYGRNLTICTFLQPPAPHPVLKLPVCWLIIPGIGGP